MKKIVQMVLTAFAVSMFVFPASADEMGVQVSINAPEYVSGTFDAAIDIVNVTDLDSGQFDLSFDANIVNVTGVASGNIGETEITVDDWRFIDNDTIRVLFNLPDVDGINGSGTLFTVHFTVMGKLGGIIVLAISDGLLIDIDSKEILALWSNTEIPVGVPVTVSAPEAVSDTFDATINITDVVDMNAGQFDLSFDPAVVNVSDVANGSIDATAIPVVNWSFIDEDTIRVLFKLSGVDGVNGSGYAAKISFEVTGSVGDTSVLEISDGKLADTSANEIPVIWINDDLAIGIPVTVNAPDSVSGTFDVTIDIEDVINMNGGQFDLNFDPAVVNVSDVTEGSIDGTAVPIAVWRFMDEDTIRVLFKLSGADGVSGSGYLAKIAFAVTGSVGNTSILEISDGKLTDTSANVIPAVWIEGEVTV